MSGESPPRKNLTSWFNKKFLQFAQSSVSSMNPSLCSPRHYRTHSSPTYMSPTRSQMEKPEEDFVIGCSVCGTRAIEETCFAENPHYGNTIDDPNSGAYARIVAYYEKPLENLTKSSVELKSTTNAHPDYEIDRPFEVTIESKQDSPVVKKIIYKEFSPPGKTPLTPLNYDQKHLVKECFFSNPTAAKFVKEEERKIVVSRRTEYMHRSSGQVKTFVRTDTGDNKSKMISRVPSELGSYYKSKNTLDDKSNKNKKNGNKSKNKNDKNGKNAKDQGKDNNKGYAIKIHTGDDNESYRESSRLSSDSSEMIIHFQLPKKNAANLLGTPNAEKIKMRSSPGSRSDSPLNQSFNSNKSSKSYLNLPGSGTRSKNHSPNPSKNSSRSPSPNYLSANPNNTNKSKNPSRPRSPANLNVPVKSPNSSRSASPNDNVTGNLKIPTKNASNSRSPINSPRNAGNFLFSDNLQAPNSKSPNSSRSSSRGNSPFGKGITKKNKKAVRSAPKKKTPPPLPKLFEPRNLREFFYIQLIAATKIQRAFRKSRETRKKNNTASQWEPKIADPKCKFSQEELLKAMRLLGSYAEYVEKTGIKLI